MAGPKHSAEAKTNTEINSVARAQHSEPTITLMGRVAAGRIGYLGVVGSGRKPDLHFTLVIDDAYSGIFGFDGQPTVDMSPSQILKIGGRPFSHVKLIKTNFYRNQIPEKVIIKINMDPPSGMSKQAFAQELTRKALNFSSYTLPYSVPKLLVGEVMVEGEHNSSSYVAGLLQSVMGYVPEISTPGYQTPGWDTPIPASYFKGEALR